jgi:hypothetical protein
MFQIGQYHVVQFFIPTCESVASNRQHWPETKAYSTKSIGSAIPHLSDHSSVPVSNGASSTGFCGAHPCAKSSPTYPWRQMKLFSCDPNDCPERLPSTFWDFLQLFCGLKPISTAFVRLSSGSVSKVERMSFKNNKCQLCRGMQSSKCAKT